MITWQRNFTDNFFLNKQYETGKSYITLIYYRFDIIFWYILFCFRLLTVTSLLVVDDDRYQFKTLTKNVEPFGINIVNVLNQKILTFLGNLCEPSS